VNTKATRNFLSFVFFSIVILSIVSMLLPVYFFSGFILVLFLFVPLFFAFESLSDYKKTHTPSILSISVTLFCIAILATFLLFFSFLSFYRSFYPTQILHFQLTIILLLALHFLFIPSLLKSSLSNASAVSLVIIIISLYAVYSFFLDPIGLVSTESLQISNHYYIAIQGLTFLLAIAFVRLLFFRGPIPYNARYKTICGIVFLLFALLLTIFFPTYIAHILPIQFVMILASVFCLYSSYEYPNQKVFYPTKSHSSDLGAENIFSFFDHMPLGYAILKCNLDKDQRLKTVKFLMVNDAASRILNQPIEFVENNTLNNVLPTIDHLLIEQFSFIFCKKKPLSTCFTHPNRRLTFQIYAFPIDHLLLGVVFLNITDKFDAEKEYYDFINTTSHELRTPITAIRESFNLLMNTWNTEKTQPQLHLQDICLRNISKMKNLIEKILDYQKFTEKDKQLKTLEQINEIVEAVYFDQLSLALSKNLKLSYQPDKNLPLIMVNRDSIETVISNLVNNAIKYSQKGTIQISTKNDQNGIIIQIQDEGMGIPQKDLRTVFEPYQRIQKLDRKGIDGSGLGLFIAKKIVLEHEGTLTADSVENKGSLFSVFLPK